MARLQSYSLSSGLSMVAAGLNKLQAMVAESSETTTAQDAPSSTIDGDDNVVQ